MATLEPLSSREKDVVKLLQEGKSNKLIAAALGISESTVEFHLKNVYAKLDVRSRVELLLKLRESTVAEAGEDAENGTTPAVSGRAASWREAVSRFGKEFSVDKVLNAPERSPGSEMTFFDAIRTCLRKYAEFSGRASRPEFWWFALFVTLVTGALTYASETAATIFLIAVLLPLLAVGARRLRDSAQNPWYLFYLLVPVGGIVVLGFLWAKPPVMEEATPAV